MGREFSYTLYRCDMSTSCETLNYDSTRIFKYHLFDVGKIKRIKKCSNA